MKKEGRKKRISSRNFWIICSVLLLIILGVVLVRKSFGIGGFVISRLPLRSTLSTTSTPSQSPSADDSPTPSPTSKEPCKDTDGDTPAKPGCVKTYTDSSCSTQGGYEADECGKDDKGNPTITEQICKKKDWFHKATCGIEECCDYTSSRTITCKDACIADCKERNIFADPKMCEKALTENKCLAGKEQKVDCGVQWKDVQSAQCSCLWTVRL